MSDLHVNQDRLVNRDLPEILPEADVVVIAGDTVDFKTYNLPKFVSWYSQIDKPIIYVMGNHEYDGFDDSNIAINVMKYNLLKYNKNTIFLENDISYVNEYLFVGATLFSDLDPIREANARRLMVGGNGFPLDLTGAWWNNKFTKSSKYIEMVLRLKSTDLSKTVIVTHFGPSFQLMDPEYKDNYSNAYFFSNLDHIFEECGPALWIHGHTHRAKDMIIGKTRVVINPRGYTQTWGDEEKSGFNPGLIVEV